MLKIQDDCTPEDAAKLHKALKRFESKRNEKRPMREGETRDDETETAIIQALALLQDTLNFEELISKTNDYNQTLAHFAVLFGYIDLLKLLVGWNIDLTIADINGLTALHCAYMKGDRACVALLLEKGASETVSDALGRAPSHLMPESFNSLNDHDTDMASGDQPDLEQQPNALSPFQRTESGHGASDSDEEKFVNNTDGAFRSSGRLLSGRADIQSCVWWSNGPSSVQRGSAQSKKSTKTRRSKRSRHRCRCCGYCGFISSESP